MIKWKKDERVYALMNAMVKRVPDIKFMYKSENWLWRRSPEKLLNAATTIGETIYLPSREWVEDRIERDPEHLFRIVAHEYLHVLDYVSCYGSLPPKITFLIMYTFPQNLSLLFLIGAVFAGLFLGWQIALISACCAIGCALPWPSPGRMDLELRGNAMNMYTRLLMNGYLGEEYIVKISDKLFGWLYYRMALSRKRVIDNVSEVYFAVKMDSVRKWSVAFEDVRKVLIGDEK